MSNEELRQLRQEYIQTELEYSELKIKYAELQQQYNELNKFTNSQCYKLLIQNEKLKIIIEKMKNCENCRHYGLMGCELVIEKEYAAVKCDKWEL